MEKMAEWHVELEDNKPEEIPPWKMAECSRRIFPRDNGDLRKVG